MKLQIKKASTDVSIYVFIQDSSSSTGAGLTGLVYNSAGLTCYYVRPLGSATQLTLATLAAVNSAHSDGGFKEVDATNMPGVYRLDLSDAIVASGVNSVVVMLKGATNMAQLVLEIELVAYDPQSATDLGLSRIDAAVSSRASQTAVDTIDGITSGISYQLFGLIPENSGQVIGSSGNDTTHIHLDIDGTYGDDELNDRLLTIYDDSTNEFHSRWISDYVGATSLATVDTLPFTPQNGVDTYWLTLIRRNVTVSATDIRSSIGLASANLDTQLSTIDDFLDTEVAAIKAKTDQLTFTTANRVDSTVVDKTGFSLSAAGIQAIWDALTTALTAVGSIGKLLVDNINATISSRASQTSLDTLDDYVDTEVAAIKAKTDNLPASPAATGDIPSVSTIADAVWDEDIVAAHTTADTAGKLLNDVEATVDTEIAAIKAKTDNLPADPADASDIASSFSTVNTKLDAIDDYVDTELAAVKTVVDAIEVDTQDIQSRLPAALTANGNIKADTLRVGGTVQTGGDLSAQIDAVDNFVDTEVNAIKTVTDKLNDTLEDDAGTYRFTTNALEQAPTGGSAPTVEQIADEVETRSLTVGTNNDKTGYGLADGAITAAKIATDAIDADSLASDAVTEIQSGLATASALSTTDGKVDLIKAKTDNLPADPADASDITSSFTTVNTKLDAIDDYVDTEIGAVKTVVDAIKVTTDKVDDTLEDDSGTYRFTENSLEQAPSGGGGGATADQVASAVWNKKVDDHLQDRSFGAQIGIHLPAVSPDIDYKKIQKITDEAISKIKIPEPITPEKFDYETLQNGFESIISRLEAIHLPETDLRPVMNEFKALQSEIKGIKFPETNLNPVLERIDTAISITEDLIDQSSAKNNEFGKSIRQFLTKDTEKIIKFLTSIKDQMENTQMVILQDKKKKDAPKKSVLDEYLTLK